VATRLAEIVRDRLPTDYLERYAAGVSGVTPKDVAAAASKYIDADHLVIVVTGDRKVLEPALKALNIAPVVVVDGNGKPISSTP
jgi:zinc protease